MKENEIHWKPAAIVNNKTPKASHVEMKDVKERKEQGQNVPNTVACQS